MTTIFNWIIDWLSNQGVPIQYAGGIARAIEMVIVGVVALASDVAFRRALLPGLNRAALRTETEWDDILLERRVFRRLSHLAPALVVYLMTPLVLPHNWMLTGVILGAALIYMVLLVASVGSALLDAVGDIYHRLRMADAAAVTGPIQFAKIGVYFVAAIFVVAILTGQSPGLLFSGLGAFTAVLLLIFRDSLLGFVAGIQLAANRMVAQGDWISVPRYDADGIVLEVALTTVKVKNFDQTITTLPTYALISESFKNWRGMTESDGRRIKRAIDINVHTVRFCNAEMLGRLAGLPYVGDYLGQAQSPDDADGQPGDGAAGDSSQLTNLGVFRVYVTGYLRAHPLVNQDMPLLVRQLAPSSQRLPLEVYAFSREKNWEAYEQLQAEVFEHVLAMLPVFELAVV